MTDILNSKRIEVVHSLIKSLSSYNKEDFEACLNAHTILTEMTESEVTFGALI